MRRSVLLLVLLCAACASQVAVREAPSAEAPRQTTRVVSFIATNDLHGHLHSLPALSGFVEHIRSQRSAGGGATFLLDAGDLFQGTLETNLTQGSAVVELYNRLGFDGVAVGNHEFDYGPEAPFGELDATDSAKPHAHPQGALLSRLRQAQFPFLSANLKRSDDKQPPAWDNLLPAVLIERAGLKVGIVGVMTEEAPDVVKRQLLSGLTITDPLTALTTEAKRLRRDGADIVVGLAHLGGECKSFENSKDLSSCSPDSELFQLVRRLPEGLVDIVFGGHRHQAVAHFVEGVAVAQAHWAGRAFSRIDVTVNTDNEVVKRHIFPPKDLCEVRDSKHCEPGLYEGKRLASDKQLALRAAEISARLTAVRQRPIGAECDLPLPRAVESESALGNLFVDLMRSAVPNADVALANAGSVRASLPAGPITFGAIYEAMPFDNRLNVGVISGAELRQLLERHVSDLDQGVASISGIRADARCANGRVTVTLSTADGAPIADHEMLKLVTSDFVATGGDRLLPEGLQHRFRDAGTSVRAALIQEMKRLGQIQVGSKQLHDGRNPRIRLSPALEACGITTL